MTTLEPSVIIGKKGITDQIIKDIKEHLKRKGTIKVKIRGAFVKGKDKEELFKEIVEKTNSRLIRAIGFNLILRKYPNRKVFK